MKKLQKHLDAIKKFQEEYKREPTALDFDNVEYLPSARTIQRLYGGLKEFREVHGFKIVDFTKGTERQKKAKKSQNEAREVETILFKKLMQKYGQNNVSSPTKVFTNSGITGDFRFCKNDIVYIVDVFYPNSTHSFKGCVSLKNKKYLQNLESMFVGKVEIIYVCLNESVMTDRDNPISILSLSEFEQHFL